MQYKNQVRNSEMCEIKPIENWVELKTKEYKLKI